VFGITPPKDGLAIQAGFDDTGPETDYRQVWRRQLPASVSRFALDLRNSHTDFARALRSEA